MFYRLFSNEFSLIELYFDLQMFHYMTLRTNYINTFDHVISMFFNIMNTISQHQYIWVIAQLLHSI